MPAASDGRMTGIDEIIDNFSLLDEWDDRYRYVIELGRTLPPLADQAHNEANKVQRNHSPSLIDGICRWDRWQLQE